MVTFIIDFNELIPIVIYKPYNPKPLNLLRHKIVEFLFYRKQTLDSFVRLLFIFFSLYC